MTAPNLVALRDYTERTYCHVEPGEYGTLSGFDPAGKWRDRPLVPEQWRSPGAGLLPFAGEPPFIDVNFSQDAFFSPQRRNSTERSFNALFVDLHCYRLGLEPTLASGHALGILETSGIPTPTKARFSGPGLNLIWLLNGQRAWPEFHAVWDACQSEFEGPPKVRPF